MHPSRLLLVLPVLALAADPGPVKFNRDIRPIMSDTCFRCHGPDKAARMAGLRLDIREEATNRTKSGVTPIIPGKPDESAIIQRIFATGGKVMPPVYAHKELTATQKETIRRWVAEGAQYEGHWAYMPATRPPVPKSPAHNPIDGFIQERLAKEGLKPSPEADPRTLIRRVTLDLTGLPPSPEETETFIKDHSNEAYLKVVDRLLLSPRYAEKQTIHWLDAVRYGDSAGFHGDNLMPAWPYRDYVLQAFLENKPFDEFTREQMAGDLIPNATTQQKIASAFNRMNRVSAEGGLQPKEYLAKYGADRVRTTATVWMGATLGCAECHDHKFDPFLSKDFYSMKAFFADIKETGLVADRGVKAWGSKLALPTEEQAARLKALTEDAETANKALQEKAAGMKAEFASWQRRILNDYESGKLAWRFQHPISATSANGARLTIYQNEPLEQNFYVGGTLVSEKKPSPGLMIASGSNPDSDTYTVTFKPGAGTWTSLGIEIFQDESLPGSRIARGADRFVLTEVDAESDGKNLPFVLATSDGFGELPWQGPMAAIDRDSNTGWSMSFGESHNPFLALRFGSKLTTSANSLITVRLHQDSAYRRATIGRFRLAVSDSEYSWPEQGDAVKKHRANQGDLCTLTVDVEHGLPKRVLDALQTDPYGRDDEQNKWLLEHFAWSTPALQDLQTQVAKAEFAKASVEGQIRQVVTVESTEPRETRILPRGDFLNETGEIVHPAIPQVFGKLDTGGRTATRLDLANWLISPSNPLTARVFVNRLWREFFGTGISKVLEDLGSQGEWPTHPELLDWMAAEFMHPEFEPEGTHDWDIKHMIRTIVTSQAYKQSSASNPTLEERDPYNRLIARQSRFRVDAEAVHDIALYVSGLLKERFGGPSVNPYEPRGYLFAMNFPKRDYSESHGDDLYRRGLYTTWQRTFLHPSLSTFDAPTREECTVNRVNSNTPLQALVLLNDPIYVEAARAFAQNILEHGGHGLSRELDWAFQRAVDRKPSLEERRILTDLYEKDLGRFRAEPENAKELLSVGESAVDTKIKSPELAAMTTVARAILNMHETITRN
jgi:hypothetical protein